MISGLALAFLGGGTALASGASAHADQSAQGKWTTQADLPPNDATPGDDDVPPANEPGWWF
ncbi:hypothetical protein [Wenjunlia tyrosinilytica]|uniref:hypothetical protein n=1 Tax=Wenjunlia tyrosinilytica TaxID=1544741 RepID=UPI0016669DB9|nr:hypothetical protein [Wenjunlia tyrosinilytica]